MRFSASVKKVQSKSVCLYRHVSVAKNIEGA